MRDRNISRHEAEAMVAHKYEGLEGIISREMHRYGGKGDARHPVRVIK